MEAELVPATEEHAFVVAALMRRDDAEECRACGLAPLEAVLGSLRASSCAGTLLLNGAPAAMWGVRPVCLGSALGGGTVGLAWLLTSRLVEAAPLLFARLARTVLRIMQSVTPVLVAYVDSRYSRAVRFLLWLGFESVAVVRMPPSGVPFHVVRLGGAHG